MNTYSNNVSKAKIRYNLKKFWWILIVAIVLGVVVGYAFTGQGAKDTKTATSVVSAVTTKSPDHTANLSDFREESPANVRILMKQLQQLQFVTNKVNKQLKKDGYSELTDADAFEVDDSDNTTAIVLTVKSSSVDRAVEINRVYTDVLVDVTQENLQETKLTVISPASAKTTAAESGGANLLSSKFIFFVIIMLVLGVIVLMLIILKDRKIRSAADIMKENDPHYLGTVGSDGENAAFTSALIEKIAERAGVEDIDMISCAEIPGEVIGALQKQCKLNINYYDNVMADAEACRRISDEVGVITVVKVDEDEMRSFYEMKHIVDVMSLNYIGTVVIA
ncbi:MAG: hypothetical protein ACOYJH_03900 [Anaerovoracaceae bacterium]|jgi:capsular polysaccharide biosynthesis protein